MNARPMMTLRFASQEEYDLVFQAAALANVKRLEERRGQAKKGPRISANNWACGILLRAAREAIASAATPSEPPAKFADY